MRETTSRIPTGADVVAAAHRIAPFVRRTPILTSRSLDDFCGRPVYVKAEHLQTTGAYKIRGGTNFIRSLLESGDRFRGVVAASSGNHGLGVAWAARAAGREATIVLPTDVVEPKRRAIADFGARIVLTDPRRTAAVAAGIAAEEGLVDVPPFDDWRIIAGQGTVVREALQDAPPVASVIVPIGGGALAAGTVLAAGDAPGRPLVFGVEPEDADDTRRSLSAGRIVELESVRSIADGLLPSRPGAVTFAVNQGGLADVVTVSDGEILEALRFVAQRTKQLIEPSAAVTIAALRAGRVPGDEPVLVVFSGGNLDLAVLGSAA